MDNQSKAKWIWYKGDFEIYHNLLLHSRREDLGVDYPCFWKLSTPSPRVNFSSQFKADKTFTMKVVTNGIGMVYIGGEKYPVNKELIVEPGEYKIQVQIIKTDGLPSIYINSEFLITNCDWIVNDCTINRSNAGDSPEFLDENCTPETFPFSYKKIKCSKKEQVLNGTLYDFEKELFGQIVIENSTKDNVINVYYGESRMEAIDPENCIIKETVSGKTSYLLKSRAFRFIYIQQSKNQSLDLFTNYEYLPLKDIAHFSCDNKIVEQIFNVCAYTFHLNSREFYLDGIKRDRWVWSGDAYQSFMINNYLYFDPEITKRTIVALLGKPPYYQHINTINDYSLFLIISIYEYYFATDDHEFIKFIYHRAFKLFEFIQKRLDEHGFVVQREGDWIFIDWSDAIDKDGPVCAEQILLWRAYQCMFELSKIAGRENADYLNNSVILKNKILKYFYCKEKGAFIDSYTSGNKNVSRHSNVLAIIYDFIDDDISDLLMQNVLENDEIPPITTPYFKFYELMAFSKLSKIEYAQDLIENYWGGMIELGATTIWEQFDPSKTGVEHYEMYGAKFGKSLCHAWGSGPIYLLGRFCLGVYPTDVGYSSFTVRPNPGKYKSFKGCVPICGGKVSVEFTEKQIKVIATKNGGTLVYNSQNVYLNANEEACIDR